MASKAFTLIILAIAIFCISVLIAYATPQVVTSNDFASSYPAVVNSIIALLVGLVGWFSIFTVIQINASLKELHVKQNSIDKSLTKLQTICRMARGVCNESKPK